MRQDRQRRREQELLCDVDEEIDALIDQEPQESVSNSDVEVFTDDGDEESGESSDEETATNADSNDAPPNPLQWSNTLGGINARVLCSPWPIQRPWGQCDGQRFLQSFHQR